MVTESTPTQETPTPSQDVLAAALRMFTDLDVDVAYTEVDIRMNTPSNAQKMQEHADAFGRMMGACMEVERESIPSHHPVASILTMYRLRWLHGLGE